MDLIFVDIGVCYTMLFRWGVIILFIVGIMYAII